MNEKQFLLICIVLFFCSALCLFCFVVLAPPQSFVIEPYTSRVSCDGGSCSFRATILQITDKNETLFYKLEKEVVVDSVFFVGTKKPTFVVGDCVLVSGSVQTFKGKESVVAQTMKKCGATDKSDAHDS